ncbi:hypothetical protein KAW50_04280, partial [candidate division WOR-3 bacterium]|nr:hypothetical protein [candidate division WOR-3 bacterium]
DDYSKINGTEYNGVLDEEDLDRDEILDRESDYFSFEIDLVNDKATIEHSNGWKLFRIPINEYDEEKGTSQWECIKYARLWIDGLSKGDEIEIAALDIVGNKWKHSGSDSVKISVKNTDENPDEYTPPPIELEKDPYGRTEREQSLVLNYNSLLNEEGGCYTVYTMAKNFIQYKSLNIWVKGTGEAKFFIRIGGNESNYYEYRCDIPKFWKEVGIDLEEVAQLKFEKSDMDTGVFVSGDYRIYGSPTFTNVGRIEFGVINEDSIGVVSGEVWIDELRLTDVRRKGGIAGNISTSVKFADLADFSLTYKANDPYFKSLGTFMSSQASKKLATNSNHSLRLHTNLSLSKFLPSSWGMSIPLDLGLTRTKSIPKYQSCSDIILTESQSAHQSSHGLDRDCSVSFSKSGSKNPLLKHTIDNIKGRVGYGDNSSFAYTKMDSSQSCYGSLSYGISPPLPPIKIKGLEFRYYPQQITLKSNYSYSLARSYLMTVVVDTTDTTTVDTSYKCTNPAPAVRGLSKEGGFSYSPINPLKLNYSMSITNDLSIEGDSTRFDKEKSNFDTETGRVENVSIGFSPSFGFISPSVDYSTTYGEDHRKTLVSLREVSNSNNLSFGLPIDLDKTLGFFTRIRDETLDSTASFGTPHWILMMMEKLFQKFHMPRLSHSISRSSRFYEVIDRPSYKYRWGISNEPVQWFSDYRNSFSITKSYGVSSVGIGIGNVSLSGGATHSISKSAGIGRSKGTCSENTEFPKLYLRISGLEKLAFLRNWLTSFTTSYDYTIGWKNSGSTGEYFHTLGRNTYYGFDLQPQWKQGISTGFSAKFSNGRDEIRGDSPSTLFEKSANYSLQGSYTFRAPTGIKVPFLSHIKWTGNLDVSLTTTYSTNFRENITKDKPLNDSKSLSITPQSSYNFSQSIRGGLNASYTRNWDHTGTGNTRNVGLTFFAEFTF